MKLTQLTWLTLLLWLYCHFELPSTVRAENEVASTSWSGPFYSVSSTFCTLHNAPDSGGGGDNGGGGCNADADTTGPESPLSERTLDCTKGVSFSVGSKWPLEPLRVVPTVRGPTDPEFPDLPPKGTDSGPASSVVTNITGDLTGNSTGSATRGASSGSTSSSLDILAPLIALERVKCAIITDYENGVNNITSLLHAIMATPPRKAKSSINVP